MDPNDEWAAPAAGWDDEPAVRAYADAAYASLLRLLPGQGLRLDGSHVCDFGCGTGLLTERLVADGVAVDAVDTSEAMLTVLRDKVATRPLLGVAVSSEVIGATDGYDLVVCSSVCSFLPDYPAVAADLVGRLRPGGVFVQWDWERSPDDAGGEGLSREEVRAALAAAGLSDITVETGFEVAVGAEWMRPLLGHGRRPATG